MDRLTAVDSQIQNQEIEETIKSRTILSKYEQKKNRKRNQWVDLAKGGQNEAPAEAASRHLEAFRKIKPRNDLIQLPNQHLDLSWWPKDQKFYNQAISSPSAKKDTFLSIPWVILGNKKFGNTLESRVLLSILSWAADENGKTRLTNKEIEKRRGPRPIRGKKIKNKADQNTPIRLLNHLRKIKTITIENQGGKNRTINISPDVLYIFQDVRDQKEKQLIIPPEIFLLNLTIPQKIYTSIRIGFQYMSVPTISKRIAISEDTIRRHHLELERDKGVLDKLAGEDFEWFINKYPVDMQPLIKPPPTLNKTPYRYILGIDMDYSLLFYNKLNPNEHSVRDNLVFKTHSSKGDKSSLRDNESNPSYKINNTSLSRQENTMPLRIAYDTPADPAWIEERRLASQRQAALNNVKPRTDYKKKPAPIKLSRDGRYAPEYEADMQWIKGNCPQIHVPKPGTRVYDDDIRVAMVLNKGLTAPKMLRRDEISAIISTVEGREFVFGRKWNYPISRKFCFDRFLGLRFDREQREELYLRLNDLMTKEYGGKGKKIRLADALCSYKGYSLLMQVAIVKPQRIRDAFPPDLDEYRAQYEQALGLTPVNMAKTQEGVLAWNIRRLKKKYIEEFRARRPRGYEGDTFYGNWPQFFKNLAEYFDNQEANIWPGWFNPDGNQVANFLAENEFREAQGSCRQQGYNKKQEESHAQW